MRGLNGRVCDLFVDRLNETPAFYKLFQLRLNDLVSEKSGHAAP